MVSDKNCPRQDGDRHNRKTIAAPVSWWEIVDRRKTLQLSVYIGVNAVNEAMQHGI
jgi:hypothetical protein